MVTGAGERGTRYEARVTGGGGSREWGWVLGDWGWLGEHGDWDCWTKGTGD